MPRPIIPSVIHHPIGPSIAYVQLTRGLYALIDSDDVDSVSQFRWRAQGREGYWYAKTSITIAAKTERSISMHRELLGLREGQWGDHKNRNTLDNRRCNLRPASIAENNRNQKVRITNTSGCTGVSFNKGDSLWWATITKNYNRVLLGKSSVFEEAVHMRRLAEDPTFGEFNPLR